MGERVGHKQKKILYVPGMISLVFLPLIAGYWIQADKVFRKLNCIELSFPRFSNKPAWGIPPFRMPARNYLGYAVNGNEVHDRSVMDSVSKSIRKILCEKDTLNGIFVRMGEHLKYEGFIGLVNICLKENVRAHFASDSGFFMLYVNIERTVKKVTKEKVDEKKELNVPIMTCGTAEMMRIQEELRRKEEEIKEQEVAIETWIRKFRPSMVLLVLLAGLGVWKLFKPQ